jgi:hypothetical protein
MKKTIYFLLFLFLLGCNKDEISDNNILFRITNYNYPTSYRKLSPAEQKQKQREFEQSQITFSVIDSFGFVGWSFDDDYEKRKQLHSSTFSDIDGLTNLVKQYLIEKSKFTGVTNVDQLIPVKIKPRFQEYGGTYSSTDSIIYNFIYIDFGNQIIEGLEVYNSLLTCMATASGVYHVFGHWYPSAFVPPVDKVNIDLAKSVLVGRKLTGHNGWGQELTHVIAATDLDGYRKIIYPYITENNLELRVCWEFKPSHWQIFMDTTTGEILLEQDTAFYLF